MDINAGIKGFDQALFIGHIRQHPQFNLMIVARDQHAAFLRQERLADFTALLIADADILQVGFTGGKTAGLGRALVIDSMDSAVGMNVFLKAFGIGAVNLGELTVIEDMVNHRMHAAELLEFVGRSGFLLAGGKTQPVIQDVRQLLGGIDIEFHVSQAPDFCLLSFDFSQGSRRDLIEN